MNNQEDEELSKIIVCSNGDLLNKRNCAEALKAYWSLNEAETRAFDRLMKRDDLKKTYLNSLKDQS